MSDVREGPVINVMAWLATSTRASASATDAQMQLVDRIATCIGGTSEASRLRSRAGYTPGSRIAQDPAQGASRFDLAAHERPLGADGVELGGETRCQIGGLGPGAWGGEGRCAARVMAHLVQRRAGR